MTLRRRAVGRVSLVNVNTRRVSASTRCRSGCCAPTSCRRRLRPDHDHLYYDGFNDTCFLYDQAVALIAFLQLGEHEAAAQAGRRAAASRTPTAASRSRATRSTARRTTPAHPYRRSAWVAYALLLADQPAYAGWFAQRRRRPARLPRADPGLATASALVNGGKDVCRGVLTASGVPWWSTEHNIDLVVPRPRRPALRQRQHELRGRRQSLKARC